MATSRPMTTAESQQFERAVCELVGINPEQINHVAAERTAGDPKITIRWEGIAHVDPADFNAALARHAHP